MKVSVTQLLDDWARKTSPVALALIFVLIGTIRTGIPGFAEFVTMLPITAVFFWAVYRPELMPYWAVFLVGLLDDMFRGTPLGFNVLALLLACALVRAQRRYLRPKGLAIQWSAYATVVGLFELGRWGLMSGLAGQLLDPVPSIVGLLLAILLYPAMAWALARAQSAFLKDA